MIYYTPYIALAVSINRPFEVRWWDESIRRYFYNTNHFLSPSASLRFVRDELVDFAIDLRNLKDALTNS